MSENQRVLVMVCTYNERENLKSLIPEIFSRTPKADLLVIDDNSPDGTGQYVDELRLTNPKIHVLHRPGKLGLGTATVAGFNYAIQNGYDSLINLDADWSHPPRFIPDIIAPSSQYDVVIGSRYVSGGSVTNWGISRQLMSQALNVYARAMLGLKTRDNSGSYRCYRVSKLAEIDWSKTRASGYAIEEEILFRLKRSGATMTEVPISYEERKHGETKLNWKEAVSAGWVLLQLRLRG
ncbi:polyprenol monophosphomannose synthase [Planctomicrobium sp. SH668]|uniref:polyprenol monophosphomannose synthase n=1 Tax=Planctomicrobium sp. SH668 TaxID=3448126 RepID=UPI003F5B6EE2